MARNPNLDGFAFYRLFQVQLQGVTQVSPARIAATATATKDITKHIAKDVGEAGTTAASSESAAGRAINTGVAKLVVGCALGGIGEYFISFTGFLELMIGVLIIRIPVRMILHRKLAVGSLDLFFIRFPGHPENLVIVALGHALKPCW